MMGLYVLWSHALCSDCMAQGHRDTMLIHRQIDSAWDIGLADAPKMLELAKKAMMASTPDYYFGILNARQIFGEVAFGAGQLDSAVYYYLLALQTAKTEKDEKETANTYTSLATIHTESGDRDSALYYSELAIGIFRHLKDSSNLCDILLRTGNVHNAMGHHDVAIASYMESIRICEGIGNGEYVAYNYGSIAIVYDKQRQYVQAESYFLKALDAFEKEDDGYGQAGVLNNLGILYKNMKAYEKSNESYTRSLKLADSLDLGRLRLNLHSNLGILQVEMGKYENALSYIEEGLKLGEYYQAKESIADNLNSKARAQAGLHDYPSALTNATEALRLSREVSSFERQRDANQTLSDIYYAMRDYEQSLAYYKTYTTINDSLFNTERSQQIAVLQTQYETEKKDHAIKLLAQQMELDRIRKTRLWLALGLSLLVGASMLYGQWARNKRDQKILSQEKELEWQKRKNAELENEKLNRELDFKKQELAAKALQLARKNEFLQSLRGDVENMRHQITGEPADTARKLSRSIDLDIESENEWEQVLTSFREVHRDFMDQLQRKYPDLTKNELRLACLMKMNLSAKEQAALLNVSPDGIKKARYRLRKTLHLDSEVDIQEYLLGFPYPSETGLLSR